MGIKILATLGPASMSEEVVSRMAESGVGMFRINLSHTVLDAVEDAITKVQSWTSVPLCLDSEGAQIRNHNMISESVFFSEGKSVRIHHNPVVGDSNNISFAPNGVSRQFQVGDVIKVDFNATSFKVVETEDQCLLAIVGCAGHVGSNKAADVDREIELEAITQKDEDAFRVGLRMGVRNFSLSFTNTAEDVKTMRKIIGREANLISKIESIRGVLNLSEIVPLVDQILIDRGDLSRQIPLEKIPFIQRKIISYAKSMETPVFVATNLLESMIKSHAPTRAEVNDVASTLLMGADGLVLAAETAIGKHPNCSVEMINALIGQFRRWNPDSTFEDILAD